MAYNETQVQMVSRSIGNRQTFRSSTRRTSMVWKACLGMMALFAQPGAAATIAAAEAQVLKLNSSSYTPEAAREIVHRFAGKFAEVAVHTNFATGVYYDTVGLAQAMSSNDAVGGALGGAATMLDVIGEKLGDQHPLVGLAAGTAYIPEDGQDLRDWSIDQALKLGEMTWATMAENAPDFIEGKLAPRLTKKIASGLSKAIPPAAVATAMFQLGVAEETGAIINLLKSDPGLVLQVVKEDAEFVNKWAVKQLKRSGNALRSFQEEQKRLRDETDVVNLIAFS